MEELKRVADRIAVLRDGQFLCAMTISRATRQPIWSA